jgi:hypothetical protein
MKSTRLLAAALVAMAASMGEASRAVMHQGMFPKAVKPPKTADLSRTAGSSRNGGRRSGNRAVQRAAIKARNVKRHRLACRG